MTVECCGKITTAHLTISLPKHTLPPSGCYTGGASGTCNTRVIPLGVTPRDYASRWMLQEGRDDDLVCG
jgi:hypothetical protein